MKEQSVKRESIIHVQNVFFTTPVNIYLARETGKYVIGYEPKHYRVHYLLYKISKELIGKAENPIKINNPVDINVREDFRNSLKFTDPNSRIEGKNVIVRIIPTRYNNISPLFATIFNFKWRKTGAGGFDGVEYSISECPMISNHNSVHNVCYKRIAHQVSFGGTHGLYTFLILSRQRGTYKVGEWIKISNIGRSGRQYKYVYPITVDL